MDQEMRDRNQMERSPGDDGDGSRNLETVIAIGGSESECGSKDVAATTEEACSSSCSIEVESGSERVCRVCHLSAKESGKSKDELMELGCGCKGELGFAHLQCAEAWFRVKGNRLCEICGEAARNVTGIGDVRFMEDWNERRWIDGSNNDNTDGRRRCLHGQPLCNFLMGCLVIAFILPWFFRVNLF